MDGELSNRRIFRTMLGTLWSWICARKRSVIAFAVVLALGLFSMGFLGFGLYLPVAPVLCWWFPPINDWKGDWVWPAVIMAGMLWSFGFLMAGVVNHRLMSRQVSTARRWSVYFSTLWLWDLTVWFLLLRFPPN